MRLRGGDRKYCIAGNWKMNPGTLDEAKKLAADVGSPVPHCRPAPRAPLAFFLMLASRACLMVLLGSSMVPGCLQTGVGGGGLEVLARWRPLPLCIRGGMARKPVTAQCLKKLTNGGWAFG